MSENYTKGVKKILKFAKEEAIRLSNTYVGSEHLLLAIIKDDSGSAAKMLVSLGSNLPNIKKVIQQETTLNDSKFSSVGNLLVLP